MADHKPVPKPRVRHQLLIKPICERDLDSVPQNTGTDGGTAETNSLGLSQGIVEEPSQVTQEQQQMSTNTGYCAISSSECTGNNLVSDSSTTPNPENIYDTLTEPQALSSELNSIEAAKCSPPSSPDAEKEESSSPENPKESLGSLLFSLAKLTVEGDDDESSSEEECPLDYQQPTEKAAKATDIVIGRAKMEINELQKSNDGVTNGEPSKAENEQIKLSKALKHKSPRAATIRVSRKKQVNGHISESQFRESVISRSSWLDVWQSRRHQVLWATLDGQVMALWKKRTDKFTEFVFHISSITNVRVQDQSRFSIYFGKKRIEFMAHSQAVHEGWVSSLHASRGQEPPPAPQQNGPLALKEPRSKVYAALCGHTLWIYRNKEDFTLGLGMTRVSMDVASAKQTGKHSFSLITPFKTFNFSTDSSKDLAVWLESLTQAIRSALSCSEVALHLWANPWNKVCADCGAANPEWASINLIVVICELCAGQHRSMGISISKVRSLKMDSKVWTNPLIQLFVQHGNKTANNVWAHNVPAAEQILPDAQPNQRGAFIKAKYIKGRYRRAHPLASSQKLLNKRLCEVVCGPDIGETMLLLCSGARVLCHSEDPQLTSPIALAEHAGQAMQTELLRHNEYTESPGSCSLEKKSRKVLASSASLSDLNLVGGEEELHGKLEDDRFLFSEQNDSAACDVLDLKEVISIFDCSSGPTYEFEMVTLTDKLVCTSDTREGLLEHLKHILKVILPAPVSDEDLEGVHAVARVSLREGERLQHTEAWVALRHHEILIHPTDGHQKDRLLLTPDMKCTMNQSEKTIGIISGERTLSMQFERDHPCHCWDVLLKVSLPSAEIAQPQPLYQLPTSALGQVPPAMERCISHITMHGLKVDGIYRRCGMVSKINQLVDALTSSPSTTKLECDEMGVLDAAGAFKQFIRLKVEFIPEKHIGLWVKAAALPVEAQRILTYCHLVKQLPPDNRAVLSALCGHLYIVQLYSSHNRMTAHNLAVVFVPTLFRDYAMNMDMLHLTREIIMHYTPVFQAENGCMAPDSNIQVTVL